MIDAGVLAIVFALTAALSWGAGDFSGGMAARKANVFTVVALSQALGLPLVVAVALFLSEPVPPTGDLAWGSAAGVFGGVGLAALYRALAVGKMGIAAPLTAVLAAALPVLFSAVVEGPPSAPRAIGFVIAIAGVWFLSRPQDLAGDRNSLILAGLAGMGFAGFFILIDQATTHALFWPLVSERITVSILMLVVVFLARRAPQREEMAGVPAKSPLPVMLISFAGVLDIVGNVFFVLAAQSGRLDIATVLSSLYPASTVLLARFALKERITRTQFGGIVAALAAILLITAS